MKFIIWALLWVVLMGFLISLCPNGHPGPISPVWKENEWVCPDGYLADFYHDGFWMMNARVTCHNIHDDDNDLRSRIPTGGS
jgi:hypothetical protein